MEILEKLPYLDLNKILIEYYCMSVSEYLTHQFSNNIIYDVLQFPLFEENIHKFRILYISKTNQGKIQSYRDGWRKTNCSVMEEKKKKEKKTKFQVQYMKL